MTELGKLQKKPREKRTAIEQCIVDAALLEEAERDGEIEMMEQAANDLILLSNQLLDRAKECHDAYLILGTNGYATTHVGKFETCPSPPCAVTRNALK